MERPAISYDLEPPWTAGMFLRLWLADVVFAAEWWVLRAVDAAVSLLLRPAALVLGLTLACSGVLVYQMKAACPSERFAALDLRAVSDAADRFAFDTGSPPARLEELVPEYLKELHRDPWGNNYVLFRGPGGLAVASAGPDGVLGTSDDLLRVVPADEGYVPPGSRAPPLLQPGDGIRAINGRRIRSTADYLTAISVPPPVDIDVIPHGQPFRQMTIRILSAQAMRFAK